MSVGLAPHFTPFYVLDSSANLEEGTPIILCESLCKELSVWLYSVSFR